MTLVPPRRYLLFHVVLRKFLFESDGHAPSVEPHQKLLWYSLTRTEEGTRAKNARDAAHGRRTVRTVEKKMRRAQQRCLLLDVLFRQFRGGLQTKDGFFERPR
jgi:hypothetical protein